MNQSIRVMNQSIRFCYEFGLFRLDTAKRCLLRESQTIPIAPKIFETLLALVEHHGEVLSKEDLMCRLWPNSFVEEGNLTYNISTLRKLLGERAPDHNYIVTIPGRGYMFVAEVNRVSIQQSKCLSKSYTNVTSLPLEKSSNKSPIDSLAILPFSSEGAGVNSEYLLYGITDCIINNLSQLPQLRVLAYNTVSRYRGVEVNAQEIGRELNICAVLMGKIQQMGQRLIIRTELVAVNDGRQLWGAQYNRQMSDIFEVEAEISCEISKALRLKLTGEERQPLSKHYPENTEAYHLCLKGRYYWSKYTKEGLTKAIKYYTQAIEIDPNYALAFAGISSSYYRLSNLYLSPQEAMPKAKVAALKAVELDDTLAESHTALGLVMELYDWNQEGAEREFLCAIECNPSLAIAHHFYGLCLSRMSKFNEAKAAFQRALNLDPLSLQINVSLGATLYMMGQYEQSIEQLTHVLEMNSFYYPACVCLGMAYQSMGNMEQAITEYENACSMDDSLTTLGHLGQSLAIVGKRNEALKICAKLQKQQKRLYVSPYYVALIYAGLGDNDKAFAWLEKTYNERNEIITWLGVNPEVNSLRSDPRFNDLLNRIDIA